MRMKFLGVGAHKGSDPIGGTDICKIVWQSNFFSTMIIFHDKKMNFGPN